MGDQSDSSFLFQCAACGRQYSVPLARLPATGARAPCKNCGKVITVYPDRRLEGAFPAAPPSLGPGESAKQTHGPTQRGAAQAASGRPPTAFIFPCPACGAPNEAALAAVPPQGLASRCANCQSPFVLQPDGSVQLQKGRVASLSSPREQEEAWEVQLEGRTVGPFGLAEMGELARQGKIGSNSPVRSVGGVWSTAAAFAALAPLVAKEPRSQEEPPQGTEDQCYAHPEAHPAFQCSQCMRYFCSACPKDSNVKVGLKALKLCPVCGGMAKPWTKPVKWTPFYLDLGQVFAAPLKGYALLYTGCLVLVQALKVIGSFSCLALPVLIILTTFQWGFYLHLIKQVAHGSYDFPEWPESSDFGDMFWSFAKVIVVALVTLIPAIAVLIFASATFGAAAMLGMFVTGSVNAVSLLAIAQLLKLAFYVAYFFYLPIPIAIVAVFDSMIPALNPVLILRIIFRIGAPFFAAYGLWVALRIILGGFQLTALLAPGPMKLAGLFLMAPLSIYVMLVSAYILGRLIHENEEKIGWV